MVLPGALPLPIIPPQIPARQNSQKELANLLHSAWMDYVHPPIIAAGDLLYGGGIGDWIYDVTHPSADEVCFTMGRGKGDKYGPLWDAPGNPGWNNPQDNQPHDPEWWKKPDNWDKMSKWKKFKWWFKRAGAALTGSGGVGM